MAETINLSNLKPPPGSRKKPKIVGRGDGSGHGTYSTRGVKGQRSRSGSKIHPWFEGGQMPLQRRIPKRGFRNIFRREFQVVNLQRLEEHSEVSEFTPEVMKKLRLVRSAEWPIKILAKGTVSRPITVKAHAFSGGAREIIEKNGGKVEIV